jgi:hypothetical protein
MTNPTIPVPLPTTGTETLNGTAPAAASVEMLQRMVLGAHDTLDRLAESAAPQLQRLEAGLTGANEALHDKADRVAGGRPPGGGPGPADPGRPGRRARSPR